jgi:hypothetical protein
MHYARFKVLCTFVGSETIEAVYKIIARAANCLASAGLNRGHR